MSSLRTAGKPLSHGCSTNSRHQPWWCHGQITANRPLVVVHITKGLVTWLAQTGPIQDSISFKDFSFLLINCFWFILPDTNPYGGRNVFLWLCHRHVRFVLGEASGLVFQRKSDSWGQLCPRKTPAKGICLRESIADQPTSGWTFRWLQ